MQLQPTEAANDAAKISAPYDEELPIAARLMPKRFRIHMLGLFDVARGADTIADDASMPEAERRLRLMQLREALPAGHIEALPIWAIVHARDISSGRVSSEYALSLLDAFIQDTFVSRYNSIAELAQYCMLSTASLGRGFLSIADETNANLRASDSLCVALQLLNHWRDIRADYTDLGRIYLPQNWLREAGVDPQHLSVNESTHALGAVYEKLGAHISLLIADAKPLSRSIKKTRLALHVRWLTHCAKIWHNKLSSSDPLAHRISLTKCDISRAFFHAVFSR